MATVTIKIWDEGEETKVQGEVDPPMTPDRLTFTTAEVVGLYLQSNIARILKEAIEWARTADDGGPDQPLIQEVKLIVPDDNFERVNQLISGDGIKGST